MTVDTTEMGLAQLLHPDAILVGYPARDAEDVIRALGQRLEAAGVVRDTFVAAVLDREARLPTGLPLGGAVNAAIPHADVEHVLRPAVGLATLAAPIAFRNMVAHDDIVPVMLVFLLALSEPKAQVEMLRQVAEVLQTPVVVEQLCQARDAAEVRTILSG